MSQRRKEKGQKQENLRKLLKLVGDLLLQPGALGILAIHQLPFQRSCSWTVYLGCAPPVRVTELKNDARCSPKRDSA